MIDYSLSYKVVKAVSGRFDVDTPSGIVTCVARKKIKNKSDILVGDSVKLESVLGENVIVSVEKRKNSLIRPAVANIDQIVMLISPVPEPDYFLVDKLILNCITQGIDCILCVNKVDIDDLTEKVKFQYADAVDAIVSVSASENEISQLIPYLNGKITCFAGQSAVGKSSLTNAILGYKLNEVGEVSEKIQRGKNTTTTTSLIKTQYGGYIVDTPGFSMLDVFDIDDTDLDLYYYDYVKLSMHCNYHRCTHTVEPGCEVKRRVESGEISKDRYERYVTLYNQIKNKRKF